jgi:hypothetical protein
MLKKQDVNTTWSSAEHYHTSEESNFLENFCVSGQSNLLALALWLKFETFVNITFSITAGTILQAYSITQFLGAFVKLRKATISFVMSVRLSIRPSVHMEQLGSHWTVFHENWYFEIFLKCVEKI